MAKVYPGVLFASALLLVLTTIWAVNAHPDKTCPMTRAAPPVEKTCNPDTLCQPLIEETIARCSQVLDCKNLDTHPYGCSPDCKYHAFEKALGGMDDEDYGSE